MWHLDETLMCSIIQGVLVGGSVVMNSVTFVQFEETSPPNMQLVSSSSAAAASSESGGLVA